MTCSENFRIDNSTDANIAKLEAALYYLQQSEIGRTILAQAAGKGVHIQFSNPVNYGNGYSAPSNTIIWDPSKGVAVQDSNGNFIGAQSSALSLAHEIAHAIDPRQMEQKDIFNAQYVNESEAEAVMYTDTIAKELGEIQRLNYKGDNANVQNVTTHTSAGPNGSQVWSQVGQNGTGESGPEYASGTKTAPDFGTVDAYKNEWEFGSGHCDDAAATAAPDPGSTMQTPIVDLGTMADNAAPVSGTVEQPPPPPEPTPEPAPAPSDGSGSSPPELLGLEPIGYAETGEPIYGGGTNDPLKPIDEGTNALVETGIAAKYHIAVDAHGDGDILSFAVLDRSIPNGATLTMASAATDVAFASPEHLVAIAPPTWFDGTALPGEVVMIGRPDHGMHHDVHHAMVR